MCRKKRRRRKRKMNEIQGAIIAEAIVSISCDLKRIADWLDQIDPGRIELLLRNILTK